jgi:hypothetical protein
MTSGTNGTNGTNATTRGSTTGSTTGSVTVGDDPLRIADSTFTSRLLLGTGKFADHGLMRAALLVSGAGGSICPAPARGTCSTSSRAA